MKSLRQLRDRDTELALMPGRALRSLHRHLVHTGRAATPVATSLVFDERKAKWRGWELDLWQFCHQPRDPFELGRRYCLISQATLYRSLKRMVREGWLLRTGNQVERLYQAKEPGA